MPQTYIIDVCAESLICLSGEQQYRENPSMELANGGEEDSF